MADSKPKTRRVPPTKAEKEAIEKAQYQQFVEGARAAGVPDKLHESFDRVVGKIAKVKKPQSR